ncbi:hypothetical protein A2U01_0099499, partial [Trifolium medium]|nr:hypothetical protein [Trifolium medium]
VLSTANCVSTNLFPTAENWLQMNLAAASAFVAFGPMNCVSCSTEQSGSDMFGGWVGNDAA